MIFIVSRTSWSWNRQSIHWHKGFMICTHILLMTALPNGTTMYIKEWRLEHRTIWAACMIRVISCFLNRNRRNWNSTSDWLPTACWNGWNLTDNGKWLMRTKRWNPLLPILRIYDRRFMDCWLLTRYWKTKNICKQLYKEQTGTWRTLWRKDISWVFAVIPVLCRILQQPKVYKLYWSCITWRKTTNIKKPLSRQPRFIQHRFIRILYRRQQ